MIITIAPTAHYTSYLRQNIENTMKTMSIRNVSLYTWYKEWDMVKHIRVLPGIVDKNTQIWWL